MLRIQSSSETRAHLFIEFAPPRQLNRCAASLGCKILAYPREIFERVVTMTAGHPAAVFKNTMGSPAQMWRSRYAFFFQVPGISDWYVKRNNFAYIETLWRDWAAPGWTLPREHLDGVKRTLEASMPSPILHYRSGGINAGKDWKKIPTPTLYLIGAEDGCVLPQMSAGQEDYFAGEFKAETIPKAGHFLHLEQPEVVGEKVTQWLKQA
ncbi:MAG: alpha/beta hydrolase [Blastocatellia bacterium]